MVEACTCYPRMWTNSWNETLDGMSRACFRTSIHTCWLTKTRPISYARTTTRRYSEAQVGLPPSCSTRAVSLAPGLTGGRAAESRWNWRHLNRSCQMCGRIQVELAPFEPLLPDVRGMTEEEAHNLGRFLNMECDILWR